MPHSEPTRRLRDLILEARCFPTDSAARFDAERLLERIRWGGRGEWASRIRDAELAMGFVPDLAPDAVSAVCKAQRGKEAA